MRPSDYGFRTIHTHNRRHPGSTPLMRELAQKYGAAHGYKGELGGWIYDSKGQHIAHGWGQFFHVFGSTIRSWAVEQKLIDPNQTL